MIQSDRSNVPESKRYILNIYLTYILDKLAVSSTFDSETRKQFVEITSKVKKRTKKKYLSNNLALSVINSFELAKILVESLNNSSLRDIVLNYNEKHIYNGAFVNEKPIWTESENYMKRMGNAYTIIDWSQYLHDRVYDRIMQVKKSLWNTYYCCDSFELHGVEYNNRLDLIDRFNYCKNVLCINCASIKSAKNYNKYKDELKRRRMYMLTLTVPNIDDNNLRSTIDRMNKVFMTIRKSFDKKNIKYKLDKISGIKKLEITYSKEKGYHPHFHILVDNYKFGNYCIENWIRIFKKDHKVECSRIAQNFPEKDQHANEESIFEIFKYFAKIIYSKIDKVTGKKSVVIIPPEIIFMIIFVTRGMKLYQSFGEFYNINFNDQEIQEDLSSDSFLIYQAKFNEDLMTYVDLQGKEFVETGVNDMTKKIVSKINVGGNKCQK